jgi:hypothetical protein
MKQNSSEYDSRLTGQEILRFLWNLEVNCHVHKSPPLDHLNSVHCAAHPVSLISVKVKLTLCLTVTLRKRITVLN